MRASAETAAAALVVVALICFPFDLGTLLDDTRAIARRDSLFAQTKETHFAAPMWRYVGHDRGKKYNGKMLRALRALKGVGPVRKLRA